MTWASEQVGTAGCTVLFPKVPTKQRPRFDARRHRTYTPDATHDAERVIQAAWRSQAGRQWADFAGEARMTVTVERSLPKSAPKRDAGTADLMCPDCDNTGKLCADALNGLAYRDDRQITCLHVCRLPRPPHLAFGERNGCRITIRVDYYRQVFKEGF